MQTYLEDEPNSGWSVALGGRTTVHTTVVHPTAVHTTVVRCSSAGAQTDSENKCCRIILRTIFSETTFGACSEVVALASRLAVVWSSEQRTARI